MPDTATSEERAAVDELLRKNDAKPPEIDAGGRIALGGLHGAVAARHLLLPALWAVQGAIGFISRGAINYIAERIQVPLADAYGVASFYALLATDERPARVAHVCDDIACRRAGGSELLTALDGRDDVHPSPCLGQCDRAPAVFVQIAGQRDRVVTGAGQEDVRALLDGVQTDIVPAPVVASGDRLLARTGITDPADLDSYLGGGGYRSLDAAVAMGRDAVIDEVSASGLRGRGGAAFPAGVKWRAVADEPGDTKYLVCNADESEPGTFKDRILLEADPFAVVEAMTIAGYAIGAQLGYLYIRGEYPEAQQTFENAVGQARTKGLLGEDVAGKGFRFDIEVRRGAGAYICGEETALFNSIEGFRGLPRQKPPFPTQAGLFGKPTVINNVETLVNVLQIVAAGGAAFAQTGTAESTGTKIFCLSGDVRNPGAYEVEFGTTLRDLIDLAGGVVGTFRAALVGGAAGSFVMEDGLDLELTFEAARDAGVSLGSGVVMVCNDETDFTDLALRIGSFFRDESCGQCVPCRVGTMRQEESLIRMAAGGKGEERILRDLALVMGDSSICGLGHAASWAVQSALAQGLIGGGE
jgi:NADH-quinone oxidoreductase subunit F